MSDSTSVGNSRVLPPKLDAYFKDYGSHHQTRGNELTHYVGIPMIMVSILGLLGGLTIGGGLTGSELFRLDGGVVLMSLAFFWYMTLDWKIGVPFVVFAYGLYLLGRAIGSPAGLWGLFVLGWILQFLGHAKYEKKSPAFLKNVLHFLIGPLWIFARWIRYAR